MITIHIVRNSGIEILRYADDELTLAEDMCAELDEDADVISYYMEVMYDEDME